MSAFPKISLSEEDFRNSAFRKSLADFLESDCGQWLIHLLREGNLPFRAPIALPTDKLEQLDAAARRESVGWEDCIRRIKLLSKPMPGKDAKSSPPSLGDAQPDDPYLPPERPITPRTDA